MTTAHEGVSLECLREACPVFGDMFSTGSRFAPGIQCNYVRTRAGNIPANECPFGGANQQHIGALAVSSEEAQ
jgi:hypothetical protein